MSAGEGVCVCGNPEVCPYKALEYSLTKEENLGAAEADQCEALLGTLGCGYSLLPWQFPFGWGLLEAARALSAICCSACGGLAVLWGGVSCTVKAIWW